MLERELGGIGFTWTFDGDVIQTECRMCHEKWVYTWHAKESMIVGDALQHRQRCRPEGEPALWS